MLRIKILRLSRGMSQWALSQAAGVSQGRYSYVERGLIAPTSEERQRLAQALHAPAATLLHQAYRVRCQSPIRHVPSERKELQQRRAPSATSKRGKTEERTMMRLRRSETESQFKPLNTQRQHTQPLQRKGA